MNKRAHTILKILAFVVLYCSANLAQQPAAADDRKRVPDPDAGKDEILILVNLTADSLKFDAVPNTTVEFPGTHRRTNVWVTDRQNLPDRVEPGVTYRNIGLQLRISTRFADIERIVREALGEVPPETPSTPPAPAGPSAAGPVTAPAEPLGKTAPARKVPIRPTRQKR
jgi:hypothetical protein